MSASNSLLLAPDPARVWSLSALAAGAVAAVLDAVLIVATQDNLADLLWPLVLLPVVLVPAPVVWPRASVRVAAAVMLAGWCFVTTFSLGPPFLLCLLLMVVAAARSLR